MLIGGSGKGNNDRTPDLPIEEKVDLKDAIDELVRTKRDAIDVLIYLTLRFKFTNDEILAEWNRLTGVGKRF